MALLQIRIEQDIKDKANQIINESHIDISTAVRLFLLMVVQEKKIPFEITTNDEFDKYRGKIEYLLDCIDFNSSNPSMTYQDIFKAIKEIRDERRKDGDE